MGGDLRLRDAAVQVGADVLRFGQGSVIHVAWREPLDPGSLVAPRRGLLD